MTGILVLEGADAAGKTTLARYLREHYGARYLHLGPYRDVWRWHLGAYLRASALARAGHLVVVDRHWWSECVYGEVYRGGAAYPIGARGLDRLWLRAAAVYVLCAPADSQRQVMEHYQRDLERKGNVYARDRARDVREVVAYYADLRFGNLARPGASYLAQLARFGDLTARPDVIVYDRFIEGGNLEVVVKGLLNRLRVHRAGQHHLGLYGSNNFAGHAAIARWLLIGEAPSPHAHPRAGFPFVDRCSNPTAATWLNRALHTLGICESNLLWVNAAGPELAELSRDPRVRHLPAIALGRVAERAAHELGFPDVRPVPHPQWARRFDHHGDYTTQLREVLR